MALSKIKANSLGTTGTPTSSTFLSGTMAWTSLTADITGVTAGTGLSGGGTSGDVTLSIDTGTTVDLSTAQTLSNKTFNQVDIEAQGDLRLQDTTGGEYVAIQAPATVASWTLTLPTDDGLASQFLQTDGAGVSTWATVITDTSGAWTSGTSTTGKALVMGF